MENKSTHYGDISKWIEKVIDSCVTYEQTLTAGRLIVNFSGQLYRKLGNGYYGDIISPLNAELWAKQMELRK